MSVEYYYTVFYSINQNCLKSKASTLKMYDQGHESCKAFAVCKSRGQRKYNRYLRHFQQ